LRISPFSRAGDDDMRARSLSEYLKREMGGTIRDDCKIMARGKVDCREGGKRAGVP
jgi:hypothetical protein